jgi:diguanylate cyclase (GGDEF)-like protein
MENFLNQVSKSLEASASSQLDRLLTPRQFLQMAGDEVERANRYDRPLSLAMVQIDHLTMLRKTDGLSIADEVINSVLSAVCSAMRGPDKTAKLGRGELGILLPETSLKHAGEVAERLKERIARLTVETEAGPRAVTLSIGVSTINPRVRDPKTFLMSGCFELRRAQSKGGNQVSVAAPEMVRMTVPRSPQIH